MSRRSTPAAVLAERRFAVRARVAVPAGGFGEDLNAIHDYLTGKLGKEGYFIGGRGGAIRPERDIMTIYADDLEVLGGLVKRFGLVLLTSDD